MSLTEDANAALIAYREIKDRIINLNYPSGMKLSEARLAEELGLGRSPIRTALARLKSEGWVAVSPQSGTYVKALTAKEIEEVTGLRLILEKHIAELATTKIHPKEVAKLRRALRALRLGDLEDHVNEYFEFDTKLHTAIYRAADNALIAGILMNLLDKVRWISRGNAGSIDRLKVSYRELERILQALEARDPQAAAEAMGAHIRNAAVFRAAEVSDKAERPRKPSGRHPVGV